VATRTYLAGLLSAIFLLVTLPVNAETYFIAPTGASAVSKPTGAKESPFPSAYAALQSGKVVGGDQLRFLPGIHGNLKLYNVTFTSPVTFVSDAPQKARFYSIYLTGSTSNLIFDGFTVSPESAGTARTHLVESVVNTSKITLLNMELLSTADAKAYVSWSAEKWNAHKVNAVLLRGANSHVENNKLFGIYNGIETLGTNAAVIGNTIKGFNGDALRGLGDNSLFHRNFVADCVVTDQNHDDGFQSWAGKSGAVKNLTIDANTILEWTGPTEHPLRCRLQGIGLFDGMYENLKITNNIVAANQYHGISVYGARGAMILNNTVVNIRGLVAVTPYIAIRPRKDGTRSTNVIVANNVAMSIQGSASTVDNVKFFSNSVIGVPKSAFVNPTNFDYRPLAESGFIDSGDSSNSTAKDVTGKNRPSGKLPDRGAFELQIESSLPASGLVTNGDTSAAGSKWIVVEGQ
jgi:parallel beta-helix repeat protein